MSNPVEQLKFSGILKPAKDIPTSFTKDAKKAIRKVSAFLKRMREGEKKDD